MLPTQNTETKKNSLSNFIYYKQCIITFVINKTECLGINKILLKFIKYHSGQRYYNLVIIQHSRLQLYLSFQWEATKY